MRKRANGECTTRAPLSAIFKDNRVRLAFERAERDRGDPLATIIIDPRPPIPFTGGAAVTLSREERERVNAEIEVRLSEAEALIAVLDASEPDPDLEDNGDLEPDADGEASLGWAAGLNQDRALKLCRSDGLENVFGVDRELDTADLEPSLGSPLAAMHDQTRWSAGNMQDLEEQCEDEGADCNALGSPGGAI